MGSRIVPIPEEFGDLVGKLIKQEMEAQGLSTKDIVERTNLSRTYVQDLLSGRSDNPSFYYTCLIVTKGLKLSLEELGSRLDKKVRKKSSL